ncbi:MAG: Plug domain-containing protein, partial [Calditrichia bacterium]
MKRACYALPAILFVCILLFVPEARGINSLIADSGNQTENSSGAADSLKSITEMPRESNHTLTFREIRLMPVTSFYDIWERQPGVIVKSGAAGGLHVRGSLSQAVEYYVDNISDGNAFNYNAPALPPINSMEEVRIIPG